MESITIKWSKILEAIGNVSQSTNEYMDLHGFYTIIAGKHKGRKVENPKLLYIGQAFKQTLRERIPQDHKKAEKCIVRYLNDNPGTTVWVQTGSITAPTLKPGLSSFMMI